MLVPTTTVIMNIYGPWQPGAQKVDTPKDKSRMEGFTKRTTEMGLGAMMYIPNFQKTDSGIQNLIGGGGGMFI
jgi:hypothetical protein